MGCARDWWGLAGQLVQEFLFVNAVFEGFASIDEDDWHFVGKLPSQRVVRFDVHFPPAKAAANCGWPVA